MVHMFPYADWIQKFTFQISVFSVSMEKWKNTEKNKIFILFSKQNKRDNVTFTAVLYIYIIYMYDIKTEEEYYVLESFCQNFKVVS